MGLLVTAHIVGVLLGTLISAPVNGVTLDPGNYIGALVLAPFEMTFGIQVFFQFYSKLIGIAMVCGLIGASTCFIWGIIQPSRWSIIGMFGASLFWSLGNAPVFCAFMSL